MSRFRVVVPSQDDAEEEDGLADCHRGRRRGLCGL